MLGDGRLAVGGIAWLERRSWKVGEGVQGEACPKLGMTRDEKKATTKVSRGVLGYCDQLLSCIRPVRVHKQRLHRRDR